MCLIVIQGFARTVLSIVDSSSCSILWHARRRPHFHRRVYLDHNGPAGASRVDHVCRMLFRLCRLRIRSAYVFQNIASHEVSCQTFPRTISLAPARTVDTRALDHVRVPRYSRDVRCAHNGSIALLPLCHRSPRPKRFFIVLRHVGFRDVWDLEIIQAVAHQLNHAQIAINTAFRHPELRTIRFTICPKRPMPAMITGRLRPLHPLVHPQPLHLRGGRTS